MEIKYVIKKQRDSLYFNKNKGWFEDVAMATTYKDFNEAAKAKEDIDLEVYPDTICLKIEVITKEDLKL